MPGRVSDNFVFSRYNTLPEINKNEKNLSSGIMGTKATFHLDSSKSGSIPKTADGIFNAQWRAVVSKAQGRNDSAGEPKGRARHRYPLPFG